MLLTHLPHKPSRKQSIIDFINIIIIKFDSCLLLFIFQTVIEKRKYSIQLINTSYIIYVTADTGLYFPRNKKNIESRVREIMLISKRRYDFLAISQTVGVSRARSRVFRKSQRRWRLRTPRRRSLVVDVRV